MPPTTLRRRTAETSGLTPQQLQQARAMSEDQLLTNVIDACRTLGLLVAHFRPARVGNPERNRFVTAVSGDGKGFPDLTIVGGWIKLRELKSHKGVLRPEQRTWIDRLAMAGVDVGVWKTTDWFSGRILRELRELAGRADAA
jgi:hypothetical protein